jgi:hypothetical protein
VVKVSANKKPPRAHKSPLKVKLMHLPKPSFHNSPEKVKGYVVVTEGLEKYMQKLGENGNIVKHNLESWTTPSYA